jgi:hypothetical protein
MSVYVWEETYPIHNGHSGITTCFPELFAEEAIESFDTGLKGEACPESVKADCYCHCGVVVTLCW